MPRAVWKFPLEAAALRGEVAVDMPLASKVLTLQVQHGTPTLWAEVILEEPRRTETRRFVVHGTGHTVPWDCEYVGTWLDGAFVWHLYEAKAR